VVTFAQPGSPGVPAATAALTHTAPFNDLGAVQAHLEAHEIAAVILEPVAGNMGCIPPRGGYLQALKALCEEHGALLIIDEVMTGFRLALGGACERFGVTPDLVCLGKIVGGGLPLAAFGGRREVMERLSPAGPVYQAGTLSGNPLAVAAGRATLGLLTPELYARLEQLGDTLDAAIRPSVEAAGASLQRVGSMFTIFFRATPPTQFAEVKECEFDKFGRFHRLCLDAGVYLPPSQYEAAFLPATLRDDEVNRVAEAIKTALSAL
jgi:glutamate-1-semialdehyde 2,1-aminomutase